MFEIKVLDVVILFMIMSEGLGILEVIRLGK